MLEDIGSYESFLLRFTTFLHLLTPEHLPGIKTDAVQLFLARMEEADDEEYRPRIRKYTIAIKEAQQIGEVSDLLITIMKKGIKRKRKQLQVDGSTELFEPYDPEYADLPELTLIRCVCRIVLPLEPEGVRFFWSGREHQWDGPEMEPMLEFEIDDCFERRMTNAGEAMARTLGKDEIELDNWIERSC